MKKLILVFVAIAITVGVYALNDSTNKIISPLGMNNVQNQNLLNDTIDKKYPDGVMMHNGKVMKIKNGKMTVLDRDITMSNGTKIMRDGTFTKKNGTKMKLKEGQHIDMSGNITFPETNKNRNTPVDRDSTKINRKK